MVTERPPRPDAPPLAARGPHRVGVRTERFTDASRARPLTVEIWYPATGAEWPPETTTYSAPWIGLTEPLCFAGRAARDAAPRPDGHRPVVLYAHGAPGSRLQSSYLCEHLASHGFVVAAIDFTGMTYGDKEEIAYVTGLVDRPNDVSFVLDELARLGWLKGMVDTANTGIAGYSFGGYTALASCGAGLDFEGLRASLPQAGDNTRYLLDFRGWLEPERGKHKGFQGDSRLRAAMVMAPWNAPALDLAQISVPLLIAIGEDDSVAPYPRDARRVYERVASAEVTLMLFGRGGHNLFSNPCPEALRASPDAWNHQSDPVWDKERATDLIKHVSLAFFKAHLSEDALPEAWPVWPGIVWQHRHGR